MALWLVDELFCEGLRVRLLVTHVTDFLYPVRCVCVCGGRFVLFVLTSEEKNEQNESRRRWI